MKILHGYRDLQNKLREPIVAIGIFDGIHIGHKKVIKKVLNSRSRNKDKVIITFDPHPQQLLHPGEKPLRLMSLEHRLFVLEKMGLDAVIIIHFTDFIAMMSPEEFIKKVLCLIGTKRVYVGSNFHFGRGKSGSVEDFQKLGKQYGIEINTVEPVKSAGKIVSSTWLRRLIVKGKLTDAEKLLRRPVSVLGTVVGGNKRGRELGHPTANIDPHHEVIPPPGVYAVKVDVGGLLFNGVLNIGFKPTFYGRQLKKRKEPHIEVHLLNYSGDMYGKTIEIFFVKKIRKEKKFRKTESLTRQIKKDIEKADNLLKGRTINNTIRKFKYFANQSV